MSVPQLDATDRDILSLDKGIRWWDHDTRCTLVVSQPSSEPDLWREYLRGALRSYRKHGVERVLDLDTIRSGADTALFFAAVAEDGTVVGGVRAKGPYRSAEESHAVVEWAGCPGLDAVRKMIADRIPFGVVEMKTAWVGDDPERKRTLTKTLARTAYPTMALLDVQFLMATAATHVLESWRSSGGLVASKIPAAPYPNTDYRTKMMWWDRRTFVNHAEPKQVSKMLAATAELTAALDARGEMLAQSGRWS